MNTVPHSEYSLKMACLPLLEDQVQYQPKATEQNYSILWVYLYRVNNETWQSSLWILIGHRSYTHNWSSCEIKNLCKSNIWSFIHSFVTFTFYAWVSYELTKWLAPRWLDSSVGRALHAPVSQRSWVQIPFRPEFFSGFNFTTA